MLESPLQRAACRVAPLRDNPLSLSFPTRGMSSSLIFRTIYALIAIFGLSLTVVRLRAGDWLAALWPALIAAFCLYRLFTIAEEE